MKVPGILYSLLLAVGSWAVTYFSTGGMGGDYVWAPLLLAGIPIVLKFFTTTEDPAPMASARGMGDAVAPSSKLRKLLLG
jgi:hypothetical protein